VDLDPGLPPFAAAQKLRQAGQPHCQESGLGAESSKSLAHACHV